MDHAKVVTKHFQIVKFALMLLHVNIASLAMFSITIFANFAALSLITVGPACLRQNVTVANLLTSFWVTNRVAFASLQSQIARFVMMQVYARLAHPITLSWVTEAADFVIVLYPIVKPAYQQRFVNNVQ